MSILIHVGHLQTIYKIERLFGEFNRKVALADTLEVYVNWHDQTRSIRISKKRDHADACLVFERKMPINGITVNEQFGNGMK